MEHTITLRIDGAEHELSVDTRTPEETAVSMRAEVISARRCGTNRPLNQLSGPIHH